MWMEKFMVLCCADGETWVDFAYTYGDAQARKQDVECGLGGYAEIYVREENGYEFLES